MRLLGSWYYLAMISVTDGLQVNPSTNRRGDRVKGQINSLKMSYLNFPKNINTWFDIPLVLGRKLSAAGIISGAGIIKYLPEQPGWRGRVLPWEISRSFTTVGMVSSEDPSQTWGLGWQTPQRAATAALQLFDFAAICGLCWNLKTKFALVI